MAHALVREVGEAGGGMARGQHEAHGVAQQLDALDARREAQRLVLPLVADHEVDVAQRERRERLLGLALDELTAQRRCLGREPVHRRQREPERDRLEACDPRPAGDGAGRGRQLGLGDRGAFE